MHEKYSIEKIADWQGFITGTVQRFEKSVKGSKPEIWIELYPDETQSPRCSKCGATSDHIHDWEELWVRDLPAWDAHTLLLVHYRRINCRYCGKHVEEIPWLEPYARVTKRLAESVARLCDFLPLKQAAKFYDLDWHLTKRIHKRYLRENYPDMDFSEVRILGMDEFAIKRGHRYATVFVDAENSRVLWVCQGRSEEHITPFFRDIIGQKTCLQIEAAVMDMWEAFENTVRKWCPHAEIVYDLFHIVRNFGKEVIDRVRVDAASKAESKEKRKVIKGSKWILLSNKNSLKSEKDKVKLDELLSTNREIFKAYVMKDDLKQLWSYKSPGAAQNFWQNWYWRGTHSRVQALSNFAKKLKGRIDGILAHCRYQFNTGLLEGINNKIKVLKRVAYGFRDHEYFFLRILQAFPGN